MSKIAKLAGVSPATSYIYFENKQDLINQLYLEIKASFSDHAFKNYDVNQPIKESFQQIWFNIANFKLKEIEEANFLSQCDNTPMIDEESRIKGSWFGYYSLFNKRGGSEIQGGFKGYGIGKTKRP
jgi:AcrR family transcriptional regulator